MAKVFRTHSTGQSQEDWFASQEIGKSITDSLTVQDTKGTKPSTSIPSPFARIDLVRTAFDKISRPDTFGKINLEGNSDDHKLISDALDIGQILFNYDRHRNDLDIVQWNIDSQTNNLKNSQNASHRHLGETLKLFLTQDGAQYNFNKCNSFYILKYKYVVIGGISPRTLFYASPRADQANVNIIFEQDRMLDSQYLPLYKREDSYIKYLVGLRNSTQNFSTLFPEFNRYLEENLNALQEYKFELYNSLMQLRNEDFEELKNLTIPEQPGIPVEVLENIKLRTIPSDTGLIPSKSSFVIKSSKNYNLPPLVLPCDPFAHDWTYTTAKWLKDTKVPYFDSRSLSERTLPDQGNTYPYLTESDFLSPVLFKLPYPINDKKFFTAGANDFLLPLTKRFFDYFNAEDIGDKVNIKIEESSYGKRTTVELTIPVKKGHIVFNKKYSHSNEVYENVDPQKKEGVIVEMNAGLAIYPFVKSTEVIKYNIGLVGISETQKDIEIKPYNSRAVSSEVPCNMQKRSSVKNRWTKHYSFNSAFDSIEILHHEFSNYLIPLLKSHSSENKTFHFAIDFGTTNTHIEYVTSENSNPVPFKIDDKNPQIQFLSSNDIEIRGQAKEVIIDAEDFLKQEMIPGKIAQNASHKFPIRTVLLENSNVNYTRGTFLFNDANIGFDYEKQMIRAYLNFRTELKWSNIHDNSNRNRILLFLEELIALCKNKVLLNNGELKSTTIAWFYPISMSGSHLKKLRQIWHDAFTNVFGNLDPLTHLREMSESIAPFYYYEGNEGIMTQTAPAVSVDIGGGTSDVVVFREGKPQLISSFRYAGNAIFGDGIKKGTQLNGFLKLFRSEYEEKLKENKLQAELAVLSDVIEKTNSTPDFINFLFSLKNNTIIQATAADFDFEKKLKNNDDLKIVFLVFFSAMFYHIAQLLKASGISKPNHILFSGTGSKSMFILNGDDYDWDSSETLINEIFDYIFEDGHKSKIKITIDKNPKELTAKGGLKNKELKNKVDEQVNIYLGGQTNLLIHRPFDIGDKNIHFNKITANDYQDVLNNVEDYLNMLDHLKTKFSFKKLFGITPISDHAFSEAIEDKSQLLEYIINGFDQQLENAGNANEPIEETLFFYPIIGILNDLAYKISQKKDEQNQ